MTIKDLQKQIYYHKDKYYNAVAEITDIEYDALENELRNLDPNNSALLYIGSEPSFGKKIKHDIPMGSLPKMTYEKTDNGDIVGDGMKHLNEWYNTHDNYIIWSMKIDGCAGQLRYTAGKLISASSRGNGCLDYTNIIEFEDGRKIPIGKICEKKISGKVKTFNHKTKKIEYNTILSHGIKPLCEQWYQIIIKDDNNIEYTVITTEEHLIFTNDDYKQINMITEDDIILIDI